MSPGDSMKPGSHLVSDGGQAHLEMQAGDGNLVLYSGSKVKLGFFQKPYILKDGVTYGTSLKLLGVQLVSIQGEAGVDTGDMSVEDVAALFGTTEGFKQADPNVTPAASTASDDEF